MVAEAQNTTVAVLRGRVADDFGYPKDQLEPVYSNVPAILVETGKQVQDPSTSTPRTIRVIECHVPYWTGTCNTDRIQDEQTGDVYIVIGVTRPPTLFGAPVDYKLDLKRITAATA